MSFVVVLNCGKASRYLHAYVGRVGTGIAGRGGRFGIRFRRGGGLKPSSVNSEIGGLAPRQADEAAVVRLAILPDVGRRPRLTGTGAPPQ